MKSRDLPSAGRRAKDEHRGDDRDDVRGRDPLGLAERNVKGARDGRERDGHDVVVDHRHELADEDDEQDGDAVPVGKFRGVVGASPVRVSVMAYHGHNERM